MKYVRFFNELGIHDIALVGGKNASLGEMYKNLAPKGIHIPHGFATTSDAYWLLLKENGIDAKMREILRDLDISDTRNLQERGKKIRALILNAALPKLLEEEILEAYALLSREYGSQAIDVAVRSSGTAEDLPDASFAGQQESFLNVSSPEALLESTRRCFASLFNDRAISYRESRGYDHFKVALSVGVQKMARSDLASSGVMFSIDTESGCENLILINSAYGLGENIVSGRINADEFFVFKPTLEKGIGAILKRSLGTKKEKMLYDKATTINIATTQEEQKSFSITEQEAIELARQALVIERHYGRPMDIEWAKDGRDQKLYVVQARPETVQSKRDSSMSIEKYALQAKDAKVLTSGKAVGDKIGAGAIRVIRDTSEFASFEEGEVLVADTTNPDWEPIMKKAAAVITNRGSRTCHAAIVAREIGVPAVVGCANAMEVLQNIPYATLSCASGDEGFVYEGALPFTKEIVNIQALKETKTKIFMNVANPAEAFNLGKTPNDGVGLARMEFVINHAINAHPMALVDMRKGKEVKDAERIRRFMTPHTDEKEFFIEKLSEGVGMIAAAFYPRSVIVRTSDFKSNEYRNMPGGLAYEAQEENPMLGFRGASRYYDESYKEAFEWECQALKRVRDDMGLTNVKIMIPFVRTPQEGKKVIEIMRSNGLAQGENALEIYAMCEIPANVILADAFLDIFDGYSIGSNDLTQLVLGVDRESAKISHIFDERNPAVKKMIEQVIESCKKRGKYVGICGQAPSDYPEITEFLVQKGIDSISLNPDSIYKMRALIAQIEESL